MDKKELKFYVAPAMDVVEVKVMGMLCSSQPTPGDDEEI